MILCFVVILLFGCTCVGDDASMPQLSMEPTPIGCWCGLQCLSKLWYGCAVGYDRL